VHLRTEPDPGLGLRTLPELHISGITLLEGENGVGKTLTVQLLELATGSLPQEFIDRPALWASLRERVGNTVLRLSSLGESDEIVVKFTAERWPSDPEVGEHIGSASIGGVPVELGQVGELLSVVRISGTEDLNATLRRRVDSLGTQLTQSAATVQECLTQIEAEREVIMGVVGEGSPDDLKADEVSLEGLAAERDAAEATVSEHDERLQLLTNALEAQRRADSIGKEAKTLIRERQRLVEEIAGLNEALTLAEEKASAADDVYAKEGGAESRLAEAERVLRMRERRRSDHEGQFRANLRMLGLDNKEQLDERYAQLQIEIKNLSVLDEDQVRRNSTRSLIGAIQTSLASASDIANETVAVLDGNDVSASSLKTGLSARREQLDDAQRAAPTDALLRLRREFAAVRSAKTRLEQLERESDLVADAANEVERASALAKRASHAAQESQKANAEYGAAKARLETGMDQLAAIQTQIGRHGNVSEEDALRDLVAASELFGVPVDKLDTVEDVAREALTLARARYEVTLGAVDAVAKRIESRHADIDVAAQSLAVSEEARWLLEADADLRSQLSDFDFAHRQAGVMRVIHALDSAVQRARAAADVLTGLRGLAEGFFSEVAESTFQATYGALFNQVVINNLLEVLNGESLRARLFDGGVVDGIDPATRTLTVTDPSGKSIIRPMDAFSTGEQALAFTQARIADLPASETPTRVVVLDEFGAFVSADRFPDLIDFLRGELDGRDRFLVILPLQVDYRSELHETTGDLHDRFAVRVESLDAVGYFVEELQS
jgi:hypothetical protein